ncbi:MAG: hypothetical protein ABSA12_17035 [Verrucomicrobiia bacterium]|jgi:hypothetical protein
MNENAGTQENVSLRKLEANQRNARKSTGPRTARGKAISRINAAKHCILSKEVVVRGLHIQEPGGAFQELRDRLWEELAPVGAVEEMLVDRIVTAHWRIRRALTAESGEIALSVDGGHWERSSRGASGFMEFFSDLRDPATEMEKSAGGLSYLIRVLEEVRADVTQEGELTEAMVGRVRGRFAGRENSLTSELAGLRQRLTKNPEGSSAKALKEEHRQAVLGRIEGKLSLYRALSGERKEREEKEEEARQAAEVLPEAAVLDKILRYETTLERQLYRAMNQLERLQRRRNGEEVPPPITMDVAGRL